jgi:hypothetical protein
LGGDFTNADLSPAQQSGVNGNGNIQYAYYAAQYNLPKNATTNHIPTSDFDPNLAGLFAEGAYPKPNITPNASNDYQNYEYVSAIPQNRWEATGKLDYSFSESTKLTGSYTRQDEADQHPLSIWWAYPNTLPYPSPVVANTTGHFIMTNFTHVFNPTTTNEFVFTYARWINPSTLGNPNAVDRSKLGFNVPSLFNHGAAVSQIPNLEGPYGGALPNISEESFDTGFDGNAFGGTKLSYALYDNVTKVIGTHTLKAGAYWDWAGDNQTSSNPENGTYNIGWGSYGTGNAVADFLLGRTGNYQEASSIPVYQIGFHQWSIYAQDSWKASRSLTINVGVRADHEGQWYGGVSDGALWFGGAGKNNIGFQVWDPNNYVNLPAGQAPGNTGLTWHAKNSSVPLSGFNSKGLEFSPRIGFAYDVFGTGRTVIRGGYATFQYQVTSQVGSAWNGPQDSFVYQVNSPDGPLNSATGMNEGYAGIKNCNGCTPPSSTVQNGASVYGMEMGDNRNPYTTDWNVTVSQSLPWRSVFEASYIGNESKNLYQDGSNGNIGNLNNTVPGALWNPDPNPASPYYGKLLSPAPPSCGSGGGESLYCYNLNIPGATYGSSGGSIATGTNDGGFDYAPLRAYQNVYLLAHTGYANYNSLQVSWQKQSGPVTFLTNYTFSKVLGVWDYVTSNGAGSGPDVDVFNLKNNYGPLAYDHTNVLNLSYIWNMPKFIHGNKLLGGAVNGWQFSGYTAFQSGAPLQPGLNGNLNAAYPGNLTVPTRAQPDLPDNSILLPNGLRSVSVNTATWYGTPSQRVLLPQITCNPRSNLAHGQYFNPNCFTTPQYGSMGTLVWPYMRGPAYFDSDLALFKNFQIRESQKLQFRVQATNFLNHALYQFGLAGNNDESLNFSKTTYETVDGVPNTAIVSLSPTNTNTGTTGKPAAKVGNRSFLLSAKYYF